MEEECPEQRTEQSWELRGGVWPAQGTGEPYLVEVCSEAESGAKWSWSEERVRSLKALCLCFRVETLSWKQWGQGKGVGRDCAIQVSGRMRSHVWFGRTTLEPAVWGRAGGEWTGGRVQWVKLLLSPWRPEYGWRHPELRQEQGRDVDRLQTC